MIARIVIAAVASLSIATMAFGQMKYSRTRSASPTPTPTPTPMLEPKPGLNKAQLEMLRPTPAPSTARPIPQMRATPAPTPAKSMPQIRGTPLPVQAKTTPQLRATATPLQGRPTPAPRTTSLPAQPKAMQTPLQAQSTPAPVKPTPTPVPPPDVKAYLARQIANSKDKKFHFTANGKDLALTPFHVWMQKSTGPSTTSTCIDMTSDEGRIYDIDFVTTGAQVTGIRIHKINGETVR